MVVHGEDKVGRLADDLGDVGIQVAGLEREEGLWLAKTLGMLCCLRVAKRIMEEEEEAQGMTYRTANLLAALGNLSRDSQGRGRDTSAQEDEGQASSVLEDTHCDSSWF